VHHSEGSVPAHLPAAFREAPVTFLQGSFLHVVLRLAKPEHMLRLVQVGGCVVLERLGAAGA
jgi:hypothetical protein